MSHDTEIIHTLELLFQPGDVFEIRVLDAERASYRRPHAESGYFDFEHRAEVPRALAQIATAAGVYVTINPVAPALLARSANRLNTARRNETTGNADIQRRRWLFIDIDPVRPAGISATDAEKSLAFDRTMEVREGLASMGWPQPVVVDSGNGCYLLYRIDLPGDDGGLVQRCLRALQPLSDGKVHIDLSVANAARICRLPGTWNRKGDDMPDRPHRLAAILDAPAEAVETVSQALLEGLVARAAPDTQPPPAGQPGASTPPLGGRPGDAFNGSGQLAPVLQAHGWERLGTSGGNELWRRPGKTSGSHSATFNGQVFYVFSSNAAPFEADKAYSPFAVYAILDHNGDFEAAARALRTQGYGDPTPDIAPGVDISGILQSAAMPPMSPDSGPVCEIPDADDPPPPEIPDPGPVPAAMLRVPGFVGEVMDYCLETAPYPNPVMAFAGALTLQAFLAGRKVRDPGDNRTNVYLLGLAHSSAGKDWPRKVNTRIAHEVGLASAFGERFASGEGIQDALFQTPSMLFQSDEIDGMLQSINKAKDARHEAVMSTLLTMYSSSNSVYPMRRKAGKDNPGVINQPCLVIFGTAIPNHYYEALSERMLTNGFFARMIILEAGVRPSGQEPTIRALPPRVLATAKWWGDYHPGTGNLENWNPVPTVIDHTDDARRLLIETREQAEAEYAAAESRGDPVGTTVWGRVSEQTRKLALIHAVSENYQAPRIGLAAVQWASAFVMHQTRRMLFMAAGHVAENPFHAECLKAVEKLRAAPGGELPHSVLLKRMKMDSKNFSMLIDTLVEQSDLKVVIVPRAGSSLRFYRLARRVKSGGEISGGGET